MGDKDKVQASLCKTAGEHRMNVERGRKERQGLGYVCNYKSATQGWFRSGVRR